MAVCFLWVGFLFSRSREKELPNREHSHPTEASLTPLSRQQILQWRKGCQRSFCRVWMFSVGQFFLSFARAIRRTNKRPLRNSFGTENQPSVNDLYKPIVHSKCLLPQDHKPTSNWGNKCHFFLFLGSGLTGSIIYPWSCD